MTTKNLLISTLLATSLTLGASAPRQRTQVSQEKSISVPTQIVASLYNRGIERDAAKKLTQNMINTDEELFSLMVENFSSESEISMDDLSHELGKMALNRKVADFSSYSFLIKLAQSVKKESLSMDELHKVENIASKNQLINRTFS